MNRKPALFEKVISAPFAISEECREFIQSLPVTTKYGWVTSKETTDPEDQRQVHVFYHHEPVVGATPIAFFNGGPRSDSHSSPRNFASYPAQSYGRWMIFIDQRGTGCSTPYPASTNIGRYLFWGTEGIVRDAEEVRKNLGLTSWNIFGQSFGSMVVLRYLDTHPQSVRIAVGHGGTSLPEFFDLRLEFQMNVVDQFLKEYPATREFVKTIVRKRLCYPDETECGGDLVQNLAIQYMGFKGWWRSLAASLESASQSTLIKPLVHQPSVPTPDTSIVHFMILLPEGLDSRSSNYNFMRTQALRLLGDSELLALTESWGWGTFAGISDEQIRETADWMKQQNMKLTDFSNIRQNLARHSEIKFYFFSSEFDYYAPPVALARTARRIGPRVHYKKLPGVGHEAFRDPEVMRVLLPILDAR